MSALLDSPGRGSSGKIRNFKAMKPDKLSVVIAELEQYGDDLEALNAAYAVAGRPTVAAADPVQKVERPPVADDNPLGRLPLGKIAQKGVGAESVRKATGSYECVIEPKLDGHRMLVWASNDGVQLYAGSGVNKTRLAPHIAEALAWLPAGTWLDGEAVVEDGLGGSHWGGVQEILGSRNDPHPHYEHLNFVAFDVLTLSGNDIRLQPLSTRRELLEDLLESSTDPVRLIPQYEASEEKHAELVAAGFEGTMVKWAHAKYASGKKGHGFFKIKTVFTDDAVVTRYEEGEGNRDGIVGALIGSQYRDGELVEVVKIGTGLTHKEYQEIADNWSDYEGRVVEFAYAVRMPSGAYRHPVFKQWRDPDDKLPTDCVGDFQED